MKTWAQRMRDILGSNATARLVEAPNTVPTKGPTGGAGDSGAAPDYTGINAAARRIAQGERAFAQFTRTLEGHGVPAEVVIEAFNLAWRAGYAGYVAAVTATAPKEGEKRWSEGAADGVLDAEYAADDPAASDSEA